MLLDLLDHEHVETILEIGTFLGGTAMVWASVVSINSGKVICVDLPIEGKRQFEGGKWERYISGVWGNSHTSEIVNRVEQVLNGQLADFLFIDGDHSYEGVKQDFEKFSPFVKSKGLIGFHDIRDTEFHRNLPPPDGPVEVCKFWDEIKDKYEHWELLDPTDATYMGIGVIRL